MSPNQAPEDELAAGLRQALRQTETDVDSVTAIRLRAARARALDAAKPRPLWLWAVPATTAATAALVAALWLPGTAPVGPASPTATESVAMEALDVLADDQAPEFYENLGFYEWLEQGAPNA